MSESISTKIENVLAASTEPLSLDEICLRVFGQLTDRNRGTIRTSLSRLDEVGRLIRFPRTYTIKKTSATHGGCL